MSAERGIFSERSLALVKNDDLSAIQSNPEFHHYITLYWAAKHGRLEIIKYLSSRGVSQESPYTPDRRGVRINDQLVFMLATTPSVIDIAIKEGHVECVKWLLDRGATCSRSTTVAALNSNRMDILRMLIERGQYVKGKSVSSFLFCKLLSKRQFESARVMIEQEGSLVPFNGTGANKYAEIVESLLDDGWWREFLFSVIRKSKYMNREIKETIENKQHHLQYQKETSESLYRESILSKDLVMYCIQPYF